MELMRPCRLDAVVLGGHLSNGDGRERVRFARSAFRRLVRACLLEGVQGSSDRAEQAVSAAEAFAQGRASSQELTEARNNASNGTTAAGVVGLPKQLPSASAQLCCFHSANVNAFEAARQSSFYHIHAVRDYATQEGAKKLGWKRSLSLFSQATAPVLAALESATHASQANALREIIANPFTGKLAIRRAARDETGVPLCPDIALGARSTNSTISGSQKHLARTSSANRRWRSL
jgi:hypothetical protein